MSPETLRAESARVSKSLDQSLPAAKARPPGEEHRTSEVDDFVKGLVALLVSLLLRSVLLPIATLWLFVKLTMQGTRLVRLG